MSKKTEVSILASVHRTAVDSATMHEFDAVCLTPVELLIPEEIRALRERK